MVDISKIKTIRQFIDSISKEYSERIIFKFKPKFRTEEYTYGQIYKYIRAAGPFFKDIGLKPKDKVIIVGPNSPQFATLLLACYYHGIIVVPSDVRFSIELINKYKDHTKPKLIFTSKLRVKDISKIIKDYLIIEDLFAYLENYKNSIKNHKIKKVGNNDLAQIIFTSGTTGTPKGVMLTNKNIISNIESLDSVIPTKLLIEALSILPLSHMFEQIIGLFLPIYIGAHILYVRKVSSLAIKKGLKEGVITQLILVPQVLKNLYRGIEKEAEKQGKGKIFKKMGKISLYLPYFLRKIIFRSVHKNLGGNIKFIVSAGAKLDINIAKNWDNMGFKIMEGYGATEVTAAATANPLNNRKLGSVGYPLKNVEVKIDKNDEVLIKGPNVAQGYYKNNEKTKEAFMKNGWYRSGDMGKIEGGRLFLLGRDAFKIVLSSGENVYVEDIESKLNEEDEIWESCVVSLKENGREQVHALIIPEKGYSEKNVDKAVKRANQKFEQHQQIVSFSVWPEEDFPRTLTQKINRKMVVDIFENHILKNKIGKEQKMEVEQKIDELHQIIADVSDKNIESISDRLNLGSDLQMDSIDRVELIAIIEDTFNVLIDDYKITAQITVKDLRKMIEKGEQATEEHPLKEQLYKWPRNFIKVLLDKLIVFPLYSILVRTKVEGIENLKSLHEPCLLFYNHIGPIDTLAVLKTLPIGKFLHTAAAGQENFWKIKTKLVSFLLENLGGAFPVSPENDAGVKSGLERIGRLLDLGQSIVFAPEGKISRSGKLQHFKRGAGVVASEMNAPVILVKLEGNYTDVFKVPKEATHTVPITSFLPKLKVARMKVKFSKPLDLTGVPYNLATEILDDAMRKM